MSTDQPYLVHRHSRKRFNAWYRRCKALGVPTVEVRQKRKYASVQWDTISMHDGCPAATTKDADMLLRDIHAKWLELATQPSGAFSGGPSIGSANGFTFEAAEVFAGYVFERLLVCTAVGRPVFRLVR